MNSYANRSNAIRAARKALATKHRDPLSGVHFRLEEVEGGWAWHEIDIATGEVATGELVRGEDPGVAECADLPPLPEVKIISETPLETREQRRLRKIREADERNAAKAEGKPATVAKPAAASKPKAEGSVATKVAQLLELVKSPDGLSETQLKAITGWSKFGGFYAAAKAANITMTREKVDGVNVWKAAA